jgi:hypothetical protein
MGDNAAKKDVSIRQYALRSRTVTSEDFDENNKATIDLTLGELQKILVIKLLVLSKGCDFRSVAHYDAFALTKSALDVLVSSLHMARQRAAVEAYSLLRVALECGSTALHISHDLDAYDQYKNGNYHSTKAISFAKKFVPILGEIWGAFSETAVHINWIGFGPKPKRNDNGGLSRSVVLEFGSRKHQRFQDQALLTSLSLVATIILKIEEMILFETNPEHAGTLQLVGTKMIYMSNTDAKILHYDEELRSYAHRYRMNRASCT